jgi:tetratricopeptide (TPR) repeat protein
MRVLMSKLVLVGLFLVAAPSGVRAQDETERRIADLKNAFEEITESFRQRMAEQEQKAGVERQALVAEREAALAERDAVRVQMAGMESTVKALEEKLAERDAEVATLLKARASSDDALRTKDEELARVQEALQAAEQANARERFALAYNLGSIYKAARQYDRAEAQFLKALAMNADDPALHYNLGILYDDNLGNAKKARQHYERFLELAPNDPDAPNVVKWLKEL